MSTTNQRKISPVPDDMFKTVFQIFVNIIFLISRHAGDHNHIITHIFVRKFLFGRKLKFLLRRSSPPPDLTASAEKQHALLWHIPLRSTAPVRPSPLNFPPALKNLHTTLSKGTAASTLVFQKLHFKLLPFFYDFLIDSLCGQLFCKLCHWL